MLELATLGLLQQQPLHGYKLKQQLEKFMSSCISVNFGSIYPLLNRLEEAQFIVTLDAEEEISNEETGGKSARTSKIYRITEAGRDRWRQKMLEHPQESWVNSRSRFTIKFFFFGHLEPAERIKLLEQRLMVCQLRKESIAAESITIDAYQVSTLQYAMQLLHSEIDWINKQLSAELTNIGGKAVAHSASG